MVLPTSIILANLVTGTPYNIIWNVGGFTCDANDYFSVTYTQVGGTGIADLPVANGTNFVNILTNQTAIAGTKNFTSNTGFGSVTPLSKVDATSADNLGATEIVRAMANNLTIGTALTYNGLYATGSGVNNNLQIGAKGSGYTALGVTSGGTLQGNVGVGVGTPTSALHINGSLATSIRESTVTAITVAATDHTVIYTTTTGIPAFTLPAATTCSGREYRLVNYSATAGTVSSYTAFTGIAATTILAQSSIVVQSNGTTWRRVE
jgi:hypothetical protein